MRKAIRILISIFVILGILSTLIYVVNPNGVVNSIKGKSRLTVTISDPPAVGDTPSFVQNRAENRLRENEAMQVAGGDYGAESVTLRFTLQLHKENGNWKDIKTMEKDMVRLAREGPENIEKNINASDYDSVRVVPKSITVVVDTPAGTKTISNEIDCSSCAVEVNLENKMNMEAGEEYQLGVDFGMGNAVEEVNPDTDSVGLELQNNVSVAHRQRGKPWKD